MYAHSGLKNDQTQWEFDTASPPALDVTADREYDAFGRTVASAGAWEGPLGYAGGFGYQSSSSNYNFQLLGHRYYDPETGRFLTRDPIKDGRNWYVYCGSNPISGTDPTGLFIWKVVVVAVLVYEAYDTAKTVSDIVREPRDVSNYGFLVAGILDPSPGNLGKKALRKLDDAVRPSKGPNAKLAGKVHETGVPFNANGYPDFSNYRYPNGENLVTIKPTGNRKGDAREANKLAGYQKTPPNYVWHHNEKYGVMELVKKDIHEQVGHEGGWCLWGDPKKNPGLGRR